MNRPDLYYRSSKLPRLDAEQIYKEFYNKMKWHADGCDTLLDIGCGPGDILVDIVYPLMPKTNSKQILGVDISSGMIEYARHLYKGHECCEFEIMDVASEKDYLRVMKGRQFDHITSHYCLHWVHNQKQALKNIYKMLRPNGGDGILVYIITTPLYDGYRELNKSLKWSSITKGYHKYTSSLISIDDPKKFMEDILQKIGFKEIQVEVRNKCYTFENIDAYKDLIESLCPLLDRIPLEKHSEFLEDFINILLEKGFIQKIYKISDRIPEIRIQYKILVVYIKK